WLLGESGTGKSSVAHSISQQLNEQERLAATFFFSRRQERRNIPGHVFLDIAYQIGCQHPHAKEVIIQAIENDPGLLHSGHPLEEQFEKLVKEPLRALRFSWTKPRTIVLDALDECDPSYESQ
ncbi:hypothetical protein CONPUDRAFT_41861, partial [Coniophora puteana RWD-64-598 SS2]